MTTNTTICIDHQAVRTSFRHWEAEQARLDAQLTESIEALAAYQSHLDGWQQQLVHERDELQHLRAAAERDLAMAGAEHAHAEAANRELLEAREQISKLTASLLARTEELRDIDHQRGDANTELAIARAREKELAAALAAQQHSFATERQQLERDVAHLRQQLERAVELVSSKPPVRGEGHKLSHPKPEAARGSSPVLGSVIEQFGKLRQQRSQGRSNSKPR